MAVTAGRSIKSLLKFSQLEESSGGFVRQEPAARAICVRFVYGRISTSQYAHEQRTYLRGHDGL